MKKICVEIRNRERKVKMNLEQAKTEFTKYIESFDLEDKTTKRKVGHSFRVMENSGKIAESLGLNTEDIKLARLIGLLHDIGRFEQLKQFHTLRDKISIDHGNLGVKILKEKDYIRKYIEEDRYDNIIFQAIKNHNKFKIEEGLSERELLFAKIVRDADKWDIFYEGVEFFWKKEEENTPIENSTITPEILDIFKSCKTISREKHVTPLDGVLGFISFIFDMNFKYTISQIKEYDYINSIFNKFNFEDEEVKAQIEEARKIVNKWLDSNITNIEFKRKE